MIRLSSLLLFLLFFFFYIYLIFCMNRVDIAMGLLDKAKMVLLVVSVDVVVKWLILLFMLMFLCLSTTCTGLTSRWVCWTRRRWSSSTSPLSRSSSSSVSTLALSWSQMLICTCQRWDLFPWNKKVKLFDRREKLKFFRRARWIWTTAARSARTGATSSMKMASSFTRM